MSICSDGVEGMGGWMECRAWRASTAWASCSGGVEGIADGTIRIGRLDNNVLLAGSRSNNKLSPMVGTYAVVVSLSFP